MIEEIKAKLDIVALVNERVPLKPAGNYYRGLCPFHADKNPSFYVSPEKQIFKCFACGEGGDGIAFLMKLENLEFKEALKLLAERTGVEWRETGASQARNLIIELNRVAQKFFREQLAKNIAAQKYLQERGLTEETIRLFGLGYVPAHNELRDYLFSLGYALKDIERAGFLTTGQYDRFRSRIIFPILDQAGQVVGFTGRIFPHREEVAKYLNTPETEAYHKSEVLFGLYQALTAIKERKQVIIVEGQLDCLLAVQSGLLNTVAVSGTALTERQLKILKRYASRLTFALDEDAAGLQAMLRSAPLAVKGGFTIDKLVLPSGKDLAEYLLQGQVDKLEAVSMLEYLFRSASQRYDLSSASGKKSFIELILPQIKSLHVVEAQTWLSCLSAMTDISESLLIEALRQLPEPTATVSPVPIMKASVFQSTDERYGSLLERLLAALVASDELSKLDELGEYFADRQELVISLRTGLRDEAAELIRLRAQYAKEQSTDLMQEVSFLIKEVKKEYCRRKIKELQALMASQPETAPIYMEEVRQYTETLRTLDT